MKDGLVKISKIMKTKIDEKILKCFFGICYNDAWRMNGINEASEILLKEVIQLLKPFESIDSSHYTDAKSIWFRAKIHGYSQWYLVTIGEDCLKEEKWTPFLTITDFLGFEVGTIGVMEESEDENDFTEILKEILAYVNEVVEDYEAYNKWVLRYLPFNLRNGLVKRSDLNRILPEYNLFEGVSQKSLEKWKNVIKKHAILDDWSKVRKEKGYKKEDYVHAWCVAIGMGDNTVREGKSELEIFNNHLGLRGGGNMDENDTFDEWYQRNSISHCCDTIYARVHLSVYHPTGLVLSYHSYPFIIETLEQAKRLDDAGIDFLIPKQLGDTMIGIIEESDYVALKGHMPSHYMSYNEEYTNQIHISDVNDPRFKELKPLVKWEAPVLLNKKN